MRSIWPGFTVLSVAACREPESPSDAADPSSFLEVQVNQGIWTDGTSSAIIDGYEGLLPWHRNGPHTPVDSCESGLFQSGDLGPLFPTNVSVQIDGRTFELIPGIDGVLNSKQAPPPDILQPGSNVTLMVDSFPILDLNAPSMPVLLTPSVGGAISLSGFDITWSPGGAESVDLRVSYFTAKAAYVGATICGARDSGAFHIPSFSGSDIATAVLQLRAQEHASTQQDGAQSDLFVRRIVGRTYAVQN